MLRIERQKSLKSLQRVKHEHGDSTEQQHRHGIFSPTHFVTCIDTREPVDESLNWSDYRIEKRALAIENMCDEDAERLCHQQYQDQEKYDL